MINQRDRRLIFQERLKNLREERRQSHAVAAKGIGINKLSLIDYEKGRSFPKLDTLMMIADYYGVDIGYLVGDYREKWRKNEDIYRETGLYSFTIESLLSRHEMAEKDINYRNNVFEPFCEFLDWFLGDFYRENTTGTPMATADNSATKINAYIDSSVLQSFAKDPVAYELVREGLISQPRNIFEEALRRYTDQIIKDLNDAVSF